LLTWLIGFPYPCNATISANNNDRNATRCCDPDFSGSMRFSISNTSDALLPDLAATGNCSQAVAIWNIQGEYEATGAEVHGQMGTCPVIALTEQLKGQCDRRIDDAFAKRITTQVLNDTCANLGIVRGITRTWQENPGVNWPYPTAITKNDFLQVWGTESKVSQFVGCCHADRNAIFALELSSSTYQVFLQWGIWRIPGAYNPHQPQCPIGLVRASALSRV
jgi:hypothetical protein